MKFHLLTALLILGFTGSSCSNNPYKHYDAEDMSEFHATPYGKDIRLGMPSYQVRQIWGEPYSVDVAGARGSGNERWVYPDGTTSRLGIGNARIIYFENGKVAGWETSQLSQSSYY